MNVTENMKNVLECKAKVRLHVINYSCKTEIGEGAKFFEMLIPNQPTFPYFILYLKLSHNIGQLVLMSLVPIRVPINFADIRVHNIKPHTQISGVKQFSQMRAHKQPITLIR